MLLRGFKALLLLILPFTTLLAQDTSMIKNTAQVLLDKKNESGLSLGAYAQLDYTQPLSSDKRYNGKMDIHRFVTFMGYKFNEKASFVSEIEIEHVKEVYIEQAFINYALFDQLNFKAGLILIPMGIVNEYHEPPTFNGTLRPNLEKMIIPSTWRELGTGFSGNLNKLSLRYQLYLVNGFASYNKEAKLKGSDGLRGGRQKGSKAMISYPNLTGKVDYYGIHALKIGLSGYFGKTQSSLYDGISTSNKAAMATADSSVVSINMISVDARYKRNALQARAEYVFARLRNTSQYNEFTSMDLGSGMAGYYIEVGYDVLNIFNNCKHEMILFGRYETYDTHYSVSQELAMNPAYDRNDVTIGVTYKLSPGLAIKADYQIFSNANGDDIPGQLNFGIGVWIY
ncbi:MAG: hypothetical protein IH946_01600 [Bacteroidetes bacterium]|nr:hypothetical protein [Bacteroidota bacterium]